MAQEIERRFLLAKLPDMPTVHRSETIEQFYFSNDTQRHQVSRCRYIDCGHSRSHIMTHKLPRKNGVGSVEIEHFISNSIYNELQSEMMIGNLIKKIRHTVCTDRIEKFDKEEKYLRWEIDIFDNGKVIAEIEIPTDDYEIDIPDWIGEYTEITDDYSYANSSLALNGWPE